MLFSWLEESSKSPSRSCFDDHNVFAALGDAAADSKTPGHDQARRLLERRHFRTVFELLPTHKQNPTTFSKLVEFAVEKYGESNVKSDEYFSGSDVNNFWVIPETGIPEKARPVSHVISNLPDIDIGLIFVAPELKDKAKKEMDKELEKLVS